MKQCPQCNYSCEDQDVVCKNCGYLFSASNPYVAPANDPQQNAQNYNYSAQQAGFSEPNINNYNQAPYQAAPKTSGLAIASLVLGLVGIVSSLCYGFGVIPAIVGIILGIVGLIKINKSDAGGKRLAIAGIIISFVAIVVGIIFAIIEFGTLKTIFNNPDFLNYANSAMQQYSSK
jgi:hypothetical protein